MFKKRSQAFKHRRGFRVAMTSAALLSTVGILAAANGSAAARSKPEASSNKRIVITFWSAESGAIGQDLDTLVSQFNRSQKKYEVQVVYKGTYPEVLADTIAAFKAHRAPDITMIFDVGTATMMDSTGVYVPVYKLMAENHIPFATSDFIGAAGTYYANANGQLDSLPFASSTPVLYYNKRMFAKIHAQPPKTWAQVGIVGKELLAHGVKNGFTTGWPDWTQFEQYAVWNNYKYATDNNGLDGIKGVKLLINTAPFVNHINQLETWEKDGVFIYDGRESTPDTLFIGGQVGMYIDSSATYASIKAGAKFQFGEAPLPYQQGAPGAPQNTVVGGNSLWVMAGAPKDTYAGDAQFLHFLMSGKSQGYWASQTGYVPVTTAGVKTLDQSGFYLSHPDALVAVHELTNKPAKPWTRAIRLGNLSEIRDIENAAITAVFSGKESAKQALDTAEQQGNAVLAQFAAQY
ncbi:MAG: sn-glycerol-3-phosphate ABC transporter substrate-binding protein [Sulfobacillus acidophilus]|uniref:sn-glycerol-3-phosphate ABC transporter substrate-binding protein n=1 Tax=Sulfobacillus acidophilus TaxID=53633 RepID=A0A2T2WJG5_9FIRM|nr:MAG: sn-glycerol-3-phosphate ABC transporter substrate-binding protein [Sulfobacillus acidophilus]